MLNSGPFPSFFSSLLIADLTQKAIKKVGQDFLKALARILYYKGIIFKSKYQQKFVAKCIHNQHTNYNAP
jgi:hypothetical protein